MNKLPIMGGITKVFHRTSFKIQKHSPEILIVAGVIGTVASAVMACKATTKVSGILETKKEEIDKIQECRNDSELAESGEYTEEDARKDLAIVYAQTGIQLIKLYAPSVILGALSITSILSSHNILRKRNVALAAAYATVDRSFKEYRDRVIDRFGEAVDRELKYNIKAKTIEETVINPETGEEETVEKTIQVSDYNPYSEYARIFDAGCKGWEKDPEHNLVFLRAQERYANDLLVSRGHLFLNEVYDMLGIPRSKAGQVVGWVYDPDSPIGDNYVDFGIYDITRPKTNDFVNGYERSVILDFNCDGDIWHLMK